MFHLTCLTLLLNTREKKVHEVSEHSNYAGLKENKLVLVWNILRHLCLSSFRRVVKSTLKRT